jgi:glycosyltransferase involved in cell wall biosynthesis
MKLLFFIKSVCAPGGAEHVLTLLGGGLAARGHEIVIVSFDPVGATPFYPVHPGIRLIQLPIGDPRQASRPIELFGRMRAMRRQLRELTPDVAIGFMNSSYVPLAPAALGTGVPTVGSEHIVYAHYTDRPLERTSMRLAATILDRIAAISEPMRVSFPRGVRRKMVVIPNPVSSDGSSPRPIRSGAKRILAVGRLEPQKNHAALVAAFARLADRFPDWQLRIVGQGELRRRLEDQANALDIADRVEFPGVVADIPGELRNARVFAMPSHYESFGLAAAEALAHGVPVVGFADCPGTNEIVEDEANGLLVQPGEIALAEGLARLMSDAALRQKLGQAGPKSMARFSVARVVTEWESLCLRLVHRQADHRHDDGIAAHG